MTRGYACIINDKEIKRVAYLPSDAYLSGYGLEILKKIIAGKLDEWFTTQIKYNQEVYIGTEPDPKFQLNWIKKDKESRSYDDWNYSEYGYIFDEKTGVLKVYHRGDILYTVKLDEYEKYAYFFENDGAVEDALTYDPEKLSFGDCYSSAVRKKIAGMSIEELKVVVKKAKTMPMPVLDDYHCVAAGHSFDRPVYIKRFRSNGKELEFIAERSRWSKKWLVLIQTPFIRVPILEDFGSETGAVKAIRKLILDRGYKKFERLAEIFEMVPELREMKPAEAKEKLKKEHKKQTWFGYGTFTPEWIMRNIRF